MINLENKQIRDFSNSTPICTNKNPSFKIGLEISFPTFLSYFFWGADCKNINLTRARW